ncbi:MAG: hypothetical protein LBU27_07770 [Candidatus Peribacteria bacterium]|nr:hypothetical protein [Candidatus Peribacteria bacterium]
MDYIEQKKNLSKIVVVKMFDVKFDVKFDVIGRAIGTSLHFVIYIVMICGWYMGNVQFTVGIPQYCGIREL